MLSPLRAALAVLLLPALGLAQGADDCSMAQPISGPGSYPFDNSAATTDGVGDPLCTAFGTDQIDNDVWFAWTASASASVTVTTCGGTGIDSKISVLDGSCAGAVLACNDDSCGLQSSVGFNATAGQTYLLRVGNFPGSAGGTGTLEVTEDLPILNPTTGNYYLAVASPGIDWDTARQEAEALSFAGSTGHLAVVTDAAEDTWIWNTLSPQADLGSYWLGGYQDTQAADYSEPDGGWRWVNGEPWVFTDWWAGEPNNNPAPEDFLIYIPTSSEPSGMWNDGGPGISSRGYIVEFGGAGLGDPYCISVANSTGAAAEIRALGSASVAANDLLLSAEPVPNQPGIFFYGPNQTLLAFGDGFRCVGGTLGRLPVENASGNLLQHLLDNTMPPNGSTVIAPGTTWNFQAWYRDPAAGGSGFNLSNGLELTFLP